MHLDLNMVPQREQYAGDVTLDSVTFGDEVRRVGAAAFRGCSNLRRVTFGESMETIEASAFRECSALEELEFPDGLSRIGNFAFQDCTSLRSILILSEFGLVIDSGAFQGCTSLRDIVIEDGVQSLDRDVFRGCTSLERVELPGSVAQICTDAFAGCRNLREVSFLPGNNDIVVEAGAFEGCGITEGEINALVAEENRRRRDERTRPQQNIPMAVGHQPRQHLPVNNNYGRTLFVCVNNTWGRQICSTETHQRVSLKDCAMGYWYLAGGLRAHQAEYLMAVCHGVVEGVWRINQERGWLPPPQIPKPTWPEDRPAGGRVGCELLDVPADVWRRYVGTRPSDFGIEMRGGHIHYSFTDGNDGEELQVGNGNEVPVQNGPVEGSPHATRTDCNGVEIVFDPGPIPVFKRALFTYMYAERTLVYTDGRVVAKRWNAQHFTPESSLLGNIRTSAYFRHHDEEGLQRVILRIPEAVHVG